MHASGPAGLMSVGSMALVLMTMLLTILVGHAAHQPRGTRAALIALQVYPVAASHGEGLVHCSHQFVTGDRTRYLSIRPLCC